MSKKILRAYITITIVFILICQTVYGQNDHFDVKYTDIENPGFAYAMEDKYITEEARFSVPFVLTRYNVVRTSDSGYLFVDLKQNKLNCVYYGSDGQVVFGNPLNAGNYVPIKGFEGQNISLVANRYNLSSLGNYDIKSMVISEDDDYFYISVKTAGSRFGLYKIRISKVSGEIDGSYLETIYELEDELCYSFGAVQAVDENGDSVYVINIDKNIMDGSALAGTLHEIYAGSDEIKLMFSEEILFSEIETGHLLRKKAVAHQAVIVDDVIYFLEGIRYEKHEESDIWHECILYSLGENVSKKNVNEIIDTDHFIENGVYYSVHMLPVDVGIGCIFNYCDVKYDSNNVYTYYSAVTVFSYTDMTSQFIKYYEESEMVDSGEGQKVKYLDYVDLLSINGKMAVVTEIRKPSDDVIFQGELFDINFITLDEEGNEASLLITRKGLQNADIKYGSSHLGNKLYVFDNVPEYDKYTEILPDDTEISFVSMGYGLAYTAEGLSELDTFTDTPVNVLEGVIIINLYNGAAGDIHAEYNGEMLENGYFTADKEGIYEVFISCTDDEGRIFSVVRRIYVAELPPETETNPPTGDLLKPFTFLFVLIMLITVLERRAGRINVN